MNTSPSAIKSALIEVVDRYFAALDEKKFGIETMKGFFSSDAKIVRPNGAVTTGPQAIGESHARTMSHFRATQHVPGNLIVTSMTGTEAHFRANITAMHVWAEGQGDPKAGPNDNYFLAGGILSGKARLQEGEWRIAEMTNDVVWRRGTGFDQLRRMVPEPDEPHPADSAGER